MKPMVQSSPLTVVELAVHVSSIKTADIGENHVQLPLYISGCQNFLPLPQPWYVRKCLPSPAKLLLLLLAGAVPPTFRATALYLIDLPNKCF